MEDSNLYNAEDNIVYQCDVYASDIKNVQRFKDNFKSYSRIEWISRSMRDAMNSMSIALKNIQEKI